MISLTACDHYYVYDGSFDGLLCCIYESVLKGELPLDIVSEKASPLTLLSDKRISTCPEQAARVKQSIPSRVSPRALELIQTVFLSCLAQKELKILRFLVKGYQCGPSVMNHLSDIDVAPLLAAERHLHGEAHKLTGFVRFADCGGALTSVITPKNFILPFIATHFSMRYKNETFLIYDKTHAAALIHEHQKAQIIAVENINLPQASPEEAHYQALWKQFYNTIAIESRINPRCRMTHMPKRYWANMVEVQDLP